MDQPVRSRAGAASPFLDKETSIRYRPSSRGPPEEDDIKEIENKLKTSFHERHREITKRPSFMQQTTASLMKRGNLVEGRERPSSAEPMLPYPEGPRRPPMALRTTTSVGPLPPKKQGKGSGRSGRSSSLGKSQPDDPNSVRTPPSRGSGSDDTDYQHDGVAMGGEPGTPVKERDETHAAGRQMRRNNLDDLKTVNAVNEDKLKPSSGAAARPVGKMMGVKDGRKTFDKVGSVVDKRNATNTLNSNGVETNSMQKTKGGLDDVKAAVFAEAFRGVPGQNEKESWTTTIRAKKKARPQVGRRHADLVTCESLEGAYGVTDPVQEMRESVNETDPPIARKSTGRKDNEVKQLGPGKRGTPGAIEITADVGASGRNDITAIIDNGVQNSTQSNRGQGYVGTESRTSTRGAVTRTREFDPSIWGAPRPVRDKSWVTLATSVVPDMERAPEFVVKSKDNPEGVLLNRRPPASNTEGERSAPIRNPPWFGAGCCSRPRKDDSYKPLKSMEVEDWLYGSHCDEKEDFKRVMSREVTDWLYH